MFRMTFLFSRNHRSPSTPSSRNPPERAQPTQMALTMRMMRLLGVCAVCLAAPSLPPVSETEGESTVTDAPAAPEATHFPTVQSRDASVASPTDAEPLAAAPPAPASPPACVCRADHACTDVGHDTRWCYIAADSVCGDTVQGTGAPWSAEACSQGADAEVPVASETETQSPTDTRVAATVTPVAVTVAPVEPAMEETKAPLSAAPKSDESTTTPTRCFRAFMRLALEAVSRCTSS